MPIFRQLPIRSRVCDHSPSAARQCLYERSGSGPSAAPAFRNDAVVEVTWEAGAERSLVRSFEQLQEARRAGAVTLKRTSMVVNCPFV
jgi:hypothetical protein